MTNMPDRCDIFTAMLTYSDMQIWFICLC